MEERFWPAWGRIREGDEHGFRALIDATPSLASDRSSVGHPTLMQALVLDGTAMDAAAQTSMALLLIDKGSPINEPFISTGSLGNTVLAELLAEHGAPLEGDPEILRGWSALEEALYWQQLDMATRLIELGASLKNLRIAAGIGHHTALLGFFIGDRLADTAGDTNFSFCERMPEQVSDNPQDVLDNALIYASCSGHIQIADELLQRGASPHALPPGFHVRGSALHYAAMHGREALCSFLIQRGADPALADATEEQRPAAAWANYGGHAKLAARLDLAQ